MKPFDLAAVRAKNLPRIDWRTMFTLSVKPGQTLAAGELEAQAKALDDYFRQFAATLTVVEGELRRIACPGCGEALHRNNTIESLLLGSTFMWGVCHGQGFCRECGYPARGHHADVGIIKSLNLVLPWHPDEIAAEPPAKPHECDESCRCCAECYRATGQDVCDQTCPHHESEEGDAVRP
jgi:hypothetical protein